MIELIKNLLKKRDESDYINALNKLIQIRQMLSDDKPKSITYKEVYITKIDF